MVVDNLLKFDKTIRSNKLYIGAKFQHSNLNPLTINKLSIHQNTRKQCTVYFA